MIEIVIPARNPGDEFTRTIDSLLDQTDRRLSVLISDNYSSVGRDRIERARERLKAAGLSVRVVKPPRELGRVQHWNWAHHQSHADWLKPLFVGDWLEPHCLSVCYKTMAAQREIAFFFFYFRYHSGDRVADADCLGLSGRVSAATAVHEAVFDRNFVGGPINVLYRRDAFELVGGHYTNLPLTADFDLYTRLATEVPTWVIPEYLGHFMLHADRFANRRSGKNREAMTYELLLDALHAAYGRAALGEPLPQLRLGFRIAQLGCAALGEWFLRRMRSK